VERRKDINTRGQSSVASKYHVKMKKDRYFAEHLILRSGSKVGNTSTVGSLHNIDRDTSPIPDPVLNSVLISNHVQVVEEVDDVLQVQDPVEPVDILAALGFNLSLGLDQLQSSLHYPSVLSITQSAFLVKMKDAIFMQRGPRDEDRGVAVMKSMAHALHSPHTCHSGEKHSGRLRMFYDPLEKQWWGWWTCCGLGELALNMNKDGMREESESFLKIC
jgi:hypothetical protein